MYAWNGNGGLKHLPIDYFLTRLLFSLLHRTIRAIGLPPRFTREKGVLGPKIITNSTSVRNLVTTGPPKSSVFASGLSPRELVGTEVLCIMARF